MTIFIVLSIWCQPHARVHFGSSGQQYGASHMREFTLDHLDNSMAPATCESSLWISQSAPDGRQLVG